MRWRRNGAVTALPGQQDSILEVQRQSVAGADSPEPLTLITENERWLDASVQVEISDSVLGDPFLIEASSSSAWFDPQRDSEGFLLEILAGGRAVMYWFTYDADGPQDWYVAQGAIQGPRGEGRDNRIVFPELMRVAGGEFGPGFYPDKVTRTVVGSASFIWSSCDSGAMKWRLDADGQPPRQGRIQLQRLSRVMGIGCGQVSLPPALEAGRLSGSWSGPSHSGKVSCLKS